MLLCSWLRPATSLRYIAQRAGRRLAAAPGEQTVRRLAAAPGEQEFQTKRWSATSVLRFQRSPFAAWLDAALSKSSGAERDRLEALRDPPDGFSLLLARKGDEWERRVKDDLLKGKDVVDLSGGVLRKTSTAETLEALSSNADVVFQAPLVGTRFAGAPDFLVREEGKWCLWDAKLSRSATPAHVAQLCCYAELLKACDVDIGDFATLALGGGRPLENCERIHLPTYAAHWRRLRSRFLSFADRFDACEEPWSVANAPLPRGDAPKDAHGRWASLASQLLVERDDLFASCAGLTSRQARALKREGVATGQRLADLKPSKRVPGVRGDALRRLRAQALLQRQDGQTPAWWPLAPKGLVSDDVRRIVLDDTRPKRPCPLPAAHPLDCFFDLEGDPLLGGRRGIEYLWGIAYRENGTLAFDAAWAHDSVAEREACKCFVEAVEERFEASEGKAHAYHYGAYERAALRRVSAGDAVLERKLEALGARGAFVDLYSVVKRVLLVGEPRYSLKNVEKLYRGTRNNTEVNDAVGSVVGYELWLSQRDPELLEELVKYNRDDCESTCEFVDWLRQAFPGKREEDIVEEALSKSEEDEEKDVLVESVLQSSITGAETAASWVDYHKREQRPGWRQRRDWLDAPAWDLSEDERCLGGCAKATLIRAPISKRATRSVFELSFQTPQITKLQEGDAVALRDDRAFTSQRASIVDIDAGKGRVRVLCSEPPPGTTCSLIPDDYVNPQPLPQAISRNLRQLLESSTKTPLKAFVTRARPTFNGREADGDLLGPFLSHGDRAKAAVEAIRQLDQGSVLAVQGPPGTGKTRLAAEALAALMRDGKRVAVCAPGHATITHCLATALDRIDVDLLCVKVGSRRRASQDDPEAALVQRSNVMARPRWDAKLVKELETDLPVLLGATAWALARDDACGTFDYVFVDEAGQVPAANLAAIASCADRIVLLGDQAQLPAPCRGAHGDHGAASCLEHYVGGAELREDQGIFLGVTYRLHPELCKAISELMYNGRLEAHPVSAKRELSSSIEGSLVQARAGLAVIDVADDGAYRSSTANAKEAAVVARVVAEILERQLVDGATTRALTTDDILVVCPYNAHVRAVENALVERGIRRVRVGTVDRFQGREAPVVVASLCAPPSSNDEDEDSVASSGRGVAFVLDVRRLNVALSRAQCLAVLVAAPDLADGSASSLDRMRELSVLSRIRELAVDVVVAEESVALEP